MGATSSISKRCVASCSRIWESGFIWPIVDANVRFVRPLVVDQSFEVTAILREWELRVVVDYRIHDLDGELCTRGRTVQVPLDAKTMELFVGTPEVLVDKIERRRARGD
jgi:acyl-CoA thioester hydrolase